MQLHPMTPLQERLTELRACSEAIKWVGDRSLGRAWRQCPRADWLLWFATEIGVDRKLVVLAACDCAETALRYVPKGEDRPCKAIETARAWTRGEATLQEVRAAAYAAADAAFAFDDVAYAGADAAADAAFAAAATPAAADPAYAADAAVAYAAYAAADAAASSHREKAMKRLAALVRKRIPYQAIKAAMA